MRREQRAFLVDKLGEERVRRIEEDLAVLGKELTEAGVAFKDMLPADGGGAQTFASHDVETTMGVFGMLVDNILHADFTPEERAEKLEDVAVELIQRLRPPDQEVKSFLARAVDAFGEDMEQGDATKAVDILSTRVKAVVDGQGRRRPTAGPAMLLMTPGSRHKHQLVSLWRALGLTAAEVSQKMRRSSGKGYGTSRVRVHQLLARPTREGEQRVLAAIKAAAVDAGRSADEIDALAGMFGVGTKEIGSRRQTNPYVRDLLVRGS